MVKHCTYEYHRMSFVQQLYAQIPHTGQQPYTQIPPHLSERLYVQGQRQGPARFGEKLYLQGLRLDNRLFFKALLKPIGHAHCSESIRTSTTTLLTETLHTISKPLLKEYTHKYHHTLINNHPQKYLTLANVRRHRYHTSVRNYRVLVKTYLALVKTYHTLVENCHTLAKT